MNKNKRSGIDNGYSVFDAPAAVHMAVNNVKLEKPLNTDVLTNIRGMTDLLDLPYSANDKGQGSVVGLCAAMSYARLEGIPVTIEIVSFGTGPDENDMENTIGMLVSETDILKGCYKDTGVYASEVMVVSIGGNRAGIIVKKEGDSAQAILLPVPTFRVTYPETLDGNPFIRKLTEDEEVVTILRKAKLPTDNTMERKEERRFHTTVEELTKYNLVSQKVRAFIQMNQLDNYQMFRDILRLLGGPLSEADLLKESEEIAPPALSDEKAGWAVRLGIGERVIQSLHGEFGKADGIRNGTPIFSTLLPVAPLNGHADEFFYTGRTDLLEPEAMTICPVNNTVLPDTLSDASVTYEFSHKPDPATCLVTFTDANDRTVRKRYGIEEFVQLRLPVVIAKYKGTDPSVPLATYSYLFDEANDPALKIRGTEKVLPDISVEIPEL